MASFGLAVSSDDSALVAGANHEEERAYWDTNSNGPQHQRHHGIPPAAVPKKPDQGFITKLSVSEIGTAYDNLTKTIGGQARVLGEQAKTFGEQAKGYTLANTSTAAAAVDRFTKQIAAAVDGAPPRPDDDQLREPGTTTADKEKAAWGGSEESQRLLQESKSGSDDEGAEGTDKDEVEIAQHPSRAGEEATAVPAPATAAAPAPGADAKRIHVNGGMVDESAPMLSFGALAAAFKKKPAGGATVTQTQAIKGGGRNALSGAVTVSSDSSATSGGGKGGAGRGGEGRVEGQSGGDMDAEGLKILPRTTSLVGGRQWAVVASVFDTTASVIDETVGDLFM